MMSTFAPWRRKDRASDRPITPPPTTMTSEPLTKGFYACRSCRGLISTTSVQGACRGCACRLILFVDELGEDDQPLRRRAYVVRRIAGDQGKPRIRSRPQYQIGRASCRE